MPRIGEKTTDKAAKMLKEAYDKGNKDVDMEWVERRYSELFSFAKEWVSPADLGSVFHERRLFLMMNVTSLLCTYIEKKKGVASASNEELTVDTIISFCSEAVSATLYLYALAEGRAMADSKRREEKLNG